MSESAARHHAEQRTVSPDLASWVAQDSSEIRDLIVEARLPARKARFEPEQGGRRKLSHVEGGGAERDATLERLKAYLSDELRLPTTILRAAGAIAILANSRQVRELAAHALVKGVRPNRNLR